MTILSPNCTCKKLTPLEWAVVALSALLLAMTQGCGLRQFTGNTTVHYKVTTPTGIITEASWENNKDEQGVEVKINPLTGEVKLKVDKSGTPSEAITAAAESAAKTQETLAKAIDLIQGLVIKGATKAPF